MNRETCFKVEAQQFESFTLFCGLEEKIKMAQKLLMIVLRSKIACLKFQLIRFDGEYRERQ